MPKAAAFTEPKRPIFHDIDVGNLLFDFKNPRLTLGRLVGSEDEMIRLLWHEMAVDEVADSIAANGFFREEPLIVVPSVPGKHDPDKDKFIVVEGNRRLAAVKLLTSESLQKKTGAKDVPQIHTSTRSDLKKLPSAVYGRREDVWAYLGFRHINGPKPWDALSKAQYVAGIFEDQGIPLEQIARQIGDRNITVKRLYRGFTLLRQAESQAGFQREDANANRFFFSHLYTAADQAEFQTLLGISDETSLRKNPVPKKCLQNLADLMLWIYGSRSKKKEPIVQTQYPDLNTLREVIRSSDGIAALKSGFALDRAHEIAIGAPQRFREAMTRAREDLVQANGTVVNGYDGDPDLLTVSEEILKLAQRVNAEVVRVNAEKKTKARA
jgi:hypothetical protein